MPKKNQPAPVSAAEIEGRIYIIRGQRVMLDSELAKLYGVTTKALNQSMRRNSERFPEDFAFQLTTQEFTNLRSQIVTAKAAHGKRRYPPWVFTEHGVAMLSSVLNSRTAIRVNVEIMRAFVRIRRLLATPGELAESVQLHDERIKLITEVLQHMMTSPVPPKGRIGFRTPAPAGSQPESPEPTP